MLQLCCDLLSFDLPRLLEVYAPERRKGVRNYLRREFFLEEDTALAIWVEDGEYVSALRLEPYEDGFLICALETREDCRNRGYALALLQAVGREVSKSLYAHVSKTNEASLAVHQKAGFHIIKDTARYLDGSADSKCCTLCRK